jgi:hypothetical protein
MPKLASAGVVLCTQLLGLLSLFASTHRFPDYGFSRISTRLCNVTIKSEGTCHAFVAHDDE